MQVTNMTSLWLYGEILVFLKYTPNSLTQLCQVFLRLVCKHMESNSLKPWGFHAIKLRKLRLLSVASKRHFRNDRAIVSHLKKKKKKTSRRKLFLSTFSVISTLEQQEGDWLPNQAVRVLNLTLWSLTVGSSIKLADISES